MDRHLLKMNVKAVSFAGMELNEDKVIYGEDYVLLLDGATSLGKNIFSNYESDGVWYVECFSKYIKNNIREDAKSCELINNAILHITEQIKNVDEKLEGNVMPSASMVLIRNLPKGLEITSIGDCSVLICFKSGKIELLQDERLPKLDGKVLKRLNDIAREKNINVVQARNEVTEDLIANRRRMNKPEGYQVLSTSEVNFNTVITEIINVDEVETIYTYSDGIAQYYDTLGIVNDFKEFAKILEKFTFEEIVEQIKTVQYEDKNFNEYPRFKISDDATIAQIKFN